MKLSRYNLKNINTEKVSVPEDYVLDLPEKVLQFGTGVLLRGLPDHYIDMANRAGLFNGKIVVVKSTSHGDTSSFDKQDGLYTICFKGLKNGKLVEENVVNASISRVLNATEEWEQILECAHNVNMQVVISNTTEVGIELINDDIRHHPPKSFPGKLLAFLLERYKAFEGSEHSGMIIIPTELITDNGKKLESIVLELAHLNGLDDTFIEWIEDHNTFCNSLVDRIVPGMPSVTELEAIEADLGYSDSLLTMAEPYGLWAIEGGSKVEEILSFSKADAGVIIAPDINIYRELKLRLLNGTHTLSCGLAYLSGCKTVKEAMDVPVVANFISDLMQKEIASAIPYEVDKEAAIKFGNEVLDRFRNPHIRHQWLSITMNYSSKMKMRCIPLLVEHYRKQEIVPELFALGFAAYLAFMKSTIKRGNQYYGELDGESYLIQDEMAEVFYKRWAGLTVTSLVQEVLRDIAFWGEDLHALPGFHHAVVEKLNLILAGGVRETLESLSTNKSFAA
jgi:tagaturonate reductase